MTKPVNTSGTGFRSRYYDIALMSKKQWEVTHRRSGEVLVVDADTTREACYKLGLPMDECTVVRYVRIKNPMARTRYAR